MGKWTNERRRILFEELKASGQLDKPLYVRAAKRAAVEKKKKAKEPTAIQQKCCIYKYGDNLPASFKRCPGCRVRIHNST